MSNKIFLCENGSIPWHMDQRQTDLQRPREQTYLRLQYLNISVITIQHCPCRKYVICKYRNAVVVFQYILFINGKK
jgi:hypothetical protein